MTEMNLSTEPMIKIPTILNNLLASSITQGIYLSSRKLQKIIIMY
ncbi:hypothetical protein yrohd0001_25740 [Yersinia rohdei ATCC 43380]|nr:hypothetical protein yrohd0001_25740 [Yersinia rohdei ATCC 43380]